MSHFSVAVISKNEDDIFELLAPYCVAGAGASSKCLEFVDETDEIKNKFFDEKNTMEIVVLKSGKLLPKYSDYFLKKVFLHSYKLLIKYKLLEKSKLLGIYLFLEKSKLLEKSLLLGNFLLLMKFRLLLI